MQQKLILFLSKLKPLSFNVNTCKVYTYTQKQPQL